MEEYLRQQYDEEITNLLNDPNDSLHVSINVDLTNLQQAHPELLAELLINTHTECKKWDSALLSAQKLLLEGNAFLEPYYQIKENCHVRFVRLPKVPGVSTFPTNAHIGRFVELKGNVVRMSQAKLLECRRQYICGRCKQTVLVEAEYSNMYVIEPPRSCRNPEGKCKGAPYQSSAQPDARHCIDFQEIRLQELISDKRMPASLIITLENDLVDACQPGDCITVCGTIERRWKPPFIPGKRVQVTLALRAISVSREEKRAAVGRDLPEHLVCVRAEWLDAVDKYGEQHVRDEILQSFCPEVHGMYLVKLAIVLALSSGMNVDCMPSQQSQTIRGNSHVILVGDPGLAKSKLLRFAARIAPRAVHTTGMGCSVAGLTAAAVKEDGEWQLEAGALVLADGGVCCIDEFNLMREEDKSAIHEAMEQQTISMAKAGLVCKLSTRCVILAATNPKRSHRNDDESASIINIGIASPLLSRFDIVLILHDDHNAGWDDRVADHLLGGDSLAPSPSLLWSIDKLQTHFMAIRDINPLITPEANEILGCYYKSCRAHPARDPARTTVRLLDSLMRLAQAHARLVFRNEVSVLDAVTVIRLMECSWGFGHLFQAEDVILKDLPLGPTDAQLFEVRSLFDLAEDCDDVGVSALRQPTQQSSQNSNREILRELSDDNRNSIPMSQKRQRIPENETIEIDSGHIEITSSTQNLASQQPINGRPTASAAKSAKWGAFVEEDNNCLSSPQHQQHIATNGRSIDGLSQEKECSVTQSAGSLIGRLSMQKNDKIRSSISQTALVPSAAQVSSSSNSRGSIGRLSLSKSKSDRSSQSATVGRSYISPLPSDVENITDAAKTDSEQIPLEKSQPIASSPTPKLPEIARPTQPSASANNIQENLKKAISYSTFLSAPPPANNEDLAFLDDIEF